MFWTKCFKIDCHTHSEQKLWRSHIIFTSHCCKFYTHLYTTFKHCTAWIFAMSSAQQKTQSCIKLYGLCVWQTQTMNEWNFKKEWPRCTAWSIFSKNHRLLSVTAHLTTTLWCVFIEKASRPHDHVSAKKKTAPHFPQEPRSDIASEVGATQPQWHPRNKKHFLWEQHNNKAIHMHKHFMHAYIHIYIYAIYVHIHIHGLHSLSMYT